MATEGVAQAGVVTLEMVQEEVIGGVTGSVGGIEEAIEGPVVASAAARDAVVDLGTALVGLHQREEEDSVAVEEVVEGSEARTGVRETIEGRRQEEDLVVEAAVEVLAEAVVDILVEEDATARDETHEGRGGFTTGTGY